MSAERLPQMDNPLVDGVPHYSPEHICYKVGDMPISRDMAAYLRRSRGVYDRRRVIQAMGQKALEVTDVAKKIHKPAQSKDIQATPIFRDPPDLQKLGRAVLRLAEHLANEEKAQQAENVTDVKEDGHAA